MGNDVALQQALVPHTFVNWEESASGNILIMHRIFIQEFQPSMFCQIPTSDFNEYLKYLRWLEQAYVVAGTSVRFRERL